MSIAIIDYDTGNIGSIKYALLQCGLHGYLASSPDDLENAERIILPGVGSFKSAMQALCHKKLDTAIKHAVLERGIPLLGICLGMQLLATKGHEGGETEGLGLIPGEVDLLRSDQNHVRLPHVGWNEILLKEDCPVFNQVPSESDCYFIHSYHFIAQSECFVIASTQYGRTFTSAVMKGKIVGVQFHPEKSGNIGRQILKNFAWL